jgi:hypothetical protein
MIAPFKYKNRRTTETTKPYSIRILTLSVRELGALSMACWLGLISIMVLSIGGFQERMAVEASKIERASPALLCIGALSFISVVVLVLKKCKKRQL